MHKPFPFDGKPLLLPLMADESHRRGRMLLRTLPILLIPVFVAIAMGWLLHLTVGIPPIPGERPEPPFAPFILLVAIAIFCCALIVLVRLGRPTASILLLIGVWTLLTTVFALLNGVTSFWPALLIMPICAAGLLLDGAASISLAALATLLVLVLGWLELQGFVPKPILWPAALHAYAPLISAGFWIALFWTIAALTYLLANGMRRAWRLSRAQAEELRALSTQLEARVAQQTAELLEQSREAARLEERTRVARDIHDTLAQGLTGIVVQLGAAQRALQVSAPDTEEHLELAASMAREALAEARRSIWNLRTPALERGSLCDALQGLAARRSRPETQIDFQVRGEPWTLSSEVESSLLRVCQEALVNISKHAGATEGHVVLEYTPESVHLTIRDNGVGFERDALASDRPAQGPWDGFGLLGMRERISAMGGTLKLCNDAGAQVQVVIPRAGDQVTHSVA
jgi:signal transduction histidine kinase